MRYLLIIIIFPFFCHSQDSKSAKSVLFIGNSFSFYWNMPTLFEKIAESEGVIFDVYSATESGASLKNHWFSEKKSQAIELIKSKKWDYVILHDHSLATIEKLEEFKIYTTNFCEMVSGLGAEPILLMTWAYKSDINMINIISKQYKSIGSDLKVKVCPIGEIFHQSRLKRADINLFSDEKHPSPDGSYLIALSLYKFISGNSISNITGRIISNDKNGQRTYHSFVKEDKVEFFKKIINKKYKKYKK